MSKFFDSAKNIEFVGRSNQAGRADGIQCMIHKGHAFVSHVFSGGVSVIDVHDPRNPAPVNFLPTHNRSWSVHIQTANDLLLVVEEFNFYSVYVKETEYYGHSIEGVHSSKFGKRGEDYTAGMRVYDISNPAHPRAIGFMEVEGLGLHRIWWVGDRYAYASALLDGYTDHIFIVIDMEDPAKPREVGRWALPGMWAAGGETMTMPGRVALHHAVIQGSIAYGSWRDGGLTLLDISDKAAPKLISHTNWSPPFAGGTHSALPLVDRGLCIVADEAVLDVDQEPMKYTWVVDIRTPQNPVTIATFPTPCDQDYVAKGGHFGPHNLHENRPGCFQSSEIIFATYQNAGVRVFDIRNQFQPQEIGFFVPSTPEQWLDTRPDRHRVIHTCDVNVQRDGLMYITDYNAGLYILQWKGV
ncbi:LVIVD repeat-containing protein [Acidisoma sp. S159]|uniref:LVIVD repeat-containing protein n=1 Tax=Acidisoma sp. S159 TaxID=1747225 RepID=UPI0015752759|nr:hypothetical protein [Acidisoma sp. S159]